VLVLTGSGSEHGASLEFSPSPSSAVITSILSRVYMSFISTDQACSTAEEETPDYDFEKVKSDARAQWNDILGRVEVRFGDAGERTTEKQKELVERFYSPVSLLVKSKELAVNDALHAICNCTGRISLPQIVSPRSLRPGDRLWMTECDDVKTLERTEPYYDYLYCNAHSDPRFRSTSNDENLSCCSGTHTEPCTHLWRCTTPSHS
jgi:hypothetical protein